MQIGVIVQENDICRQQRFQMDAGTALNMTYKFLTLVTVMFQHLQRGLLGILRVIMMMTTKLYLTGMSALLCCSA